MIIELTLIFIMIIIAIFLRNKEPIQLLEEAMKLLIIGFLLVQYPFALICIAISCWIRQTINSFTTIQQQPTLKETTKVFSPRGLQELQIVSTNSEQQQQPLEAVFIIDHLTGESQYAVVQKADKSTLAQLGITLKNTVILERGRPESKEQSRLISNLDVPQNLNKRLNNVSIHYEDQSEFQKNHLKQYKSIPFKIGDFDKQMGEIVQMEILSTDGPNESQKLSDVVERKYEDMLFLSVLGCAIPQFQPLLMRILLILLISIPMQKFVHYGNRNLITLTYLMQISITITLFVCGFVIGNYVNLQEAIWGMVLFVLYQSNSNLQQLILPVPIIIKYLIIDNLVF